MKTYSELCHPDGDKELKDDIDYEIAATAEFLVANSSDPKATKDALDRALAGNQSALRAFPKSKTALLCQAGPDEHEHGLPSAMYRALGAKTHEERRAAVTRLLTEPGPPLGMCFP